METIIHLKRAETVFGVLELSGGDMFWYECKFVPTAAFDEVKPLFNRHSNRHSNVIKLYQQLKASGLRLLNVTNGKEINDFMLFIEGDQARFRIGPM